MMNLLRLKWMLLLFVSNVLFAQTPNAISPCSSKLNNQICTVNDINDLQLIQFNYGMQYVRQLINIYKNNTPEKNQRELEGDYFSVIVAPNQKMYLINNVEKLIAYDQVGKSQHYQYKYYIKIIYNFTTRPTFTMQDFWQWMNNAHYVWLNDKGVSKATTQLPSHISSLSNDPYLTLAKLLENSQWCYKVSAQNTYNNLDFYWADYLRSLVQEAQIPNYNDPDITTVAGRKSIEDYLDYINRVGVCHVNVADKLPGFCQYNNECYKNDVK